MPSHQPIIWHCRIRWVFFRRRFNSLWLNCFFVCLFNNIGNVRQDRIVSFLRFLFPIIVKEILCYALNIEAIFHWILVHAHTNSIIIDYRNDTLCFELSTFFIHIHTDSHRWIHVNDGHLCDVCLLLSYIHILCRFSLVAVNFVDSKAPSLNAMGIY